MAEAPTPHHSFPDLASQVEYSPDNFKAKVVFEREQQKAILFAFEQGQQLQEHKTAHDVLLVMLEGTCLFSIFREQLQLQAGQVYRIPAQEPHALLAVCNFKMMLLK